MGSKKWFGLFMQKIKSMKRKYVIFLSNKKESHLFSICFSYMTCIIFLKTHSSPPNPKLFLINKCCNYHNSIYDCYNESINQGHSYTDTNIQISDCFFSRSFQLNGFGGVIYINGGTYSMNISNSIFFSCACSINGGAIFFSSDISILKMICAQGCYAESYHFAYIQAINSNKGDGLSINNCSYLGAGYYPLWLQSGDQFVEKVNSSMNNALQSSGIGISSPSSFISSHCTFSNNNASHSICIYFSSNIGSMSYANIVHNNSPSWGGVVYSSGTGSCHFTYCIFDLNQNTLFYLNSGSMEISHSMISHANTFSSMNSIQFQNNNSVDTSFPPIPRQTYQIQFFNTHYCHTDFPQVLETPLRTNIISPVESPIESFEKTYVELICSCQIAKKKEINMIFSFSFFQYLMNQ